MAAEMRRTHAGALNTVIPTIAFGVVYTVVARFGLCLDPVSGFATLVWPSTGLALAALLLFGIRLWPGLFVGAFVVNLEVGATPIGALGIAVGNTSEALLGAYLMKRYGAEHGAFNRVRHVLALVLGAAVTSTVVSATVGVAALSLAGIISSVSEAVTTWRAWWLGDAIGDLVTAPLLLTWAPRQVRVRSMGRRLEAGALVSLLALVSIRIFFGPAGAIEPLVQPYAIFPLLVWAALRFEMHGATLATALTSAIATWGTADGRGPFASESLSASLLPLQSFMGFAALTPLIIAGVTLERANAIRMRDSILAFVSHDLKNPIHALVMSAEILNRKLPLEPVEKHHALTKRCADSMLRLIADLLDIAALESGQLALEPRDDDMRALAMEAIELARPLAGARTFTLVASEPIMVRCDRARVLQVLSNLVGNAIKFSAEGSTITLAIEKLPCSVQVSVHDSGRGIEAIELPHVFERFWRKGATGAGTGLGLFICKGIVEAHGGRIWAESKVGEGSTFFFTVPYRILRPIHRPSSEAEAMAAVIPWKDESKA